MGYREGVALSGILLCLSLLVGCSQALLDQISEMFSIHDALVNAYDHEDIAFQMENGTHLTISFVNSRFNDLHWQEKKKKAEEIARFSASLLDEGWAVQSLSVRFTIEKKIYLVIDYTNTLATFRFNVNALKQEAQAMDAIAIRTGPRRPTGTEEAAFGAGVPIQSFRLSQGLQTGRRGT